MAQRDQETEDLDLEEGEAEEQDAGEEEESDEDQLARQRTLDQTTLQMIEVASSKGKGLRLPDYFRALSPRSLKEHGFTKPELSWSLYRLWLADEISMYPLDERRQGSDDSLQMSAKGPKGTPRIGLVKIRRSRSSGDELEPSRPPKPGLPRKSWPLTAMDYILQGAPIVVAYGLGVDSTAVLVNFKRIGLKPDAILFANVGSEKPETYWYRDKVMKPWLKKVGFPAITEVSYKMTERGITRRLTEGGVVPKEYTSLEENCLFNFDLPSWAYGMQRHSCSDKWKVKPQENWIANSEEFGRFARNAWAKGLPVIRVIGFDAGKHDSDRRWKIKDNTRYLHWYPLIDWEWSRDRCIKEIEKEGLPVPVKSACFFCPSSQPAEIEQLVREHPDLADRIIQMEDGVRPFLGDEGKKRRQKFKKTGVYPDVPTNELPDQGLWYLGGKGKPGRMADFIQQYRRLCLTDPDNPRCKGWQPGPEYAHLAKGIKELPLKRRLPILKELP